MENKDLSPTPSRSRKKAVTSPIMGASECFTTRVSKTNKKTNGSHGFLFFCTVELLASLRVLADGNALVWEGMFEESSSWVQTRTLRIVA